MNFLKDAGKFITKEVPKFFVKTIPGEVKKIPNPTDRATWEPELPSLRKREKKAAAKLTETRERFLSSKDELAQVQAEYRVVLEDYSSRLGEKAAANRFRRVKGGQWDDPTSDADVIVRGIGNTLRDVVGFITLDLTETIFAPGEAKKEKEFLKKRIAALRAAEGRIASADARIAGATAELKKDIADALAELRAHGLADDADGASRRVLKTAADDAALEMARRMRADGVSPERITLLTNVDAATIASFPMPADENAEAASPDAATLEDQAGQMLEDSVPTLYVAELTGLSQDRLAELADERGLQAGDAEEDEDATQTGTGE